MWLTLPFLSFFLVFWEKASLAVDRRKAWRSRYAAWTLSGDFFLFSSERGAGFDFFELNIF